MHKHFDNALEKGLSEFLSQIEIPYDSTEYESYIVEVSRQIIKKAYARGFHDAAAWILREHGFDI